MDDDKLAIQVPITSFNKGMLEAYCCGFIGANKKTFCLKAKNNCSSYYNKGAPFNNPFKVQPDTYYIAKDQTGNKAWCEPCVSKKLLLKLLPNADNEILDSSVCKTLKEWKTIFNAAKSLNTGVHHTSQDLKGHVKAFIQPPPINAMKTPFKHCTQALVNYNNQGKSNFAADIKEAQEFVKQEDTSKFTISAANQQHNSMEKLLLAIHFMLDTFQ